MPNLASKGATRNGDVSTSRSQQMSVSEVTRWSAMLILSCSVLGCQVGKPPAGPAFQGKTGAGQSAPTEKKMQSAIQRRLIVSKENAAGQLVQVGVLTFETSGQITLAAERSTPASDQLIAAWDEISKLKELTWKYSQPDVINGEKVVRIVGEAVKPGDGKFIFAVMNTLERRYGFDVELDD